MANVFSLGRTFKVVGTDGRIRGEWVVLLPPRGREHEAAWISPHEVVIYDELLRSGVILNKRDLTAKVVDGVAEISLISSHRREDVEEVRDDLLALLVDIARMALPSDDLRRDAEWRWPIPANYQPGDAEHTLLTAQRQAYILGRLDGADRTDGSDDE